MSDKSFRSRLTDGSMPSLSLLALNEKLPKGLCWKCSRDQGFYSSPCEHCGAINPNFDLDGALAQQDDLCRERVK